MGHLKPPKLLVCLTLSLLMTLMTMSAASAFTDTNNHWASASIEKWSEGYQIIQGYSDGTFRPDAPISRGAFAGILNRLMHYPTKSGASVFSDIKGNYWEDAILRLHAASVYQGSGGRAAPQDPITRQQAVTMIARAFRVTADRAYTHYTDEAKISEYAKIPISEMTERGYLRTVSGIAFRPGDPITRAEVLAIFNNMATVLVSTPQVWSGRVNGNIMVNSQSGANLQNVTATGDLIIAPGVAGKVTLTDADFWGRTVNLSKSAQVVENTTPAVSKDISATVTFKVVNGFWDGGSAQDIVVTLSGKEGDALTLLSSDVPFVGSRPADGYKAEGTWSPYPSSHTLSDGAQEVYTFTYAKDDTAVQTRIGATVTFKVVNGAWNDGSTRDVTVNLEGVTGERLMLPSSSIPAVGSQPASGYQAAGSWSPRVPVPGEVAAGASEVYTFTYTAAPQSRTVSATVTFRVVNGAWNNGDMADVTVNLSGPEGMPLTLTAAQIPVAGSRPATGYQAGTWSPQTPSAGTVAAGSNQVYTYTYNPIPVIRDAGATVIFRVVNGSWNDGTSTDVTVNLSGPEGTPLTLTAAQIPGVGSRPNAGYQAGSWSPRTPSAGTVTANSSEIYTYTYAAVPQARTVSATVTFRVANGSWNDGTSTDVVVNLSGPEGTPLTLTAAQIPAAGSRPNGGYQAGSWSPRTPSAGTVSPGTSEVYTYTYAPAVVQNVKTSIVFKVVNGSWNSGSSDNTTVNLTGQAGTALTIPSYVIPSVGSRPDYGYSTDGVWTPRDPASGPVTAGNNETFTFTYNKANTKTASATVTFKVVNGSWNNGSSDDVVLNLTGQSGARLQFDAGSLPAVGSRPASGYKAGSWSPVPYTHDLFDGSSEVYTYTYVVDTAAATTPSTPTPAAPDDPWAAPVNTTPSPSGTGTDSTGTTPATPTVPSTTTQTNVPNISLPDNPLAKPVSSYPKNRTILPSDVYTPSATTGEFFTYGSRSIPVYARLQSNQTKAGDFTWNGKRLNYVGSRYRVTFGVDVSSYQGSSVNWTAAKNAGVQFAMIRVAYRGWGSTGTLQRDTCYAKNLDNAMKAGLTTGAYVFATAITVEEAIKEADYVISLLKGHNINGPVAYDWEINASNYRNANVSKQMATACAVAFCEKIKAAGYAPMVYMSQYVGYVKYDMGALRTYLKWYPQYPATSNKTPFPNYRYQVDLWQFSDSVTISGIGSNVDSNLWFWPK